MARHLLIGNGGVASLVNAASETDAAINVQKLSADGPVNMVAGDTVADSDSFRIVQGTAGNNIYSPWIKGRNVINWSGQSGAAAAAHQGTVTCATESTSKGEVVIKFIRKDGTAPDFFSFTTSIGSDADVDISANDAATAIHDAFEALDGIPDWLNPLAGDSSGVVTFSGALRGDEAQSGNTWESGPAIFDIIVESSTVAAQTYTVANGSQAGDPGSGDGNLVREMEKVGQGVGFGYYNRRNLPNEPALKAVAATSYDMYSIVATKDGSTSSSINGVDNLIEINIASPAGNVAGPILEGKLNSYMASLNFPVVIL